MARTQRAPAGSVNIGRQVSRLVAEVGVKATANLLNISPASVNRVLSASTERKMGKAFHTPKGLEAWTRRLTNAKTTTTPEVRRVIEGRTRPDRHAPARTRAGLKQQEQAGTLRAQYRDKDIAKALGVSRQKATAMRQAAARGKADAATTRQLAEARAQLAQDYSSVRDGIKILSQAAADRALQDPKVTSRHQDFTGWKDVKEYTKEILGGNAPFVRIVNRGTALNPHYDVLVSENSEDFPDPPAPEDEDWDYGDEPDYADEQDERDE